MELLGELLMELILEGSIEISSNKKISKWIRYPLILLIILFYVAIIGLVLFLGVTIIKNNLVGGLFIIGLGIFMLIAAICSFRKTYIKKKIKLEKE